MSSFFKLLMVTYSEKWVYRRYGKTTGQWFDRSQLDRLFVKLGQFEEMTMSI